MTRAYKVTFWTTNEFGDFDEYHVENGHTYEIACENAKYYREHGYHAKVATVYCVA